MKDCKCGKDHRVDEVRCKCGRLLVQAKPAAKIEGFRVKSPLGPGLGGDTAASGHGLNDGSVSAAAPTYLPRPAA